MTPKQIALVQASWKRLQPVAPQAAELFYTRLFTLDPSLRRLFRGDMDAQGRKLMAMIGVAVGSLERLDSIIPGLQLLGRRHAGYGVQERHYETVGEALLWTLDQGLGEAFTAEVREAWATAYGLLAGAMKDAAPLSRAA